MGQKTFICSCKPNQILYAQFYFLPEGQLASFTALYL